MSSRNVVSKASKALMVMGAAVVIASAGIGFTGYPLASARASETPARLISEESEMREIAKFAGIDTVQAAEDSATVTTLAKKKKAKRVRPLTRWSRARASWYGPGLYGNQMAGGGKLRRNSMIVAHKTMKFGTKIQFSYHGRKVIAVVRDRGPYISGRSFDLGPGTARKLRFDGVGTVKWRKVK